MGFGGRLYAALENILREMNIINLNACISVPVAEDEYLTCDSESFHRHIGFSEVGRFHKCGYKFGRWYDLIWMEKMLSSHPDTPADVVKIGELKGLIADKYGIN